MYKSRCITELCKLSHVFLEGSARKNPPQSFGKTLNINTLDRPFAPFGKDRAICTEGNCSRIFIDASFWRNPVDALNGHSTGT